MKRFIFLLILLLPLFGNAQIYNGHRDSSDTFIRNTSHYGMYHLRYSLGVFPEVQFINSPVIGMSVSYARLLDVEWSAFGRGVNLGFEFDPLEKFYGPKLTLWSCGGRKCEYERDVLFPRK